ncbi:hypothetical protein [Streptomyces ochraceiscleroticus]|uniref:Secreted protein n=1 Tax=Streptomyces ochraceiscleroticus TaxID=47761 RepID=A0ABW1MEQ2_9ACTN|nr:hypothetical protein [Streptomyces ochraceiscleroticus]
MIRKASRAVTVSALCAALLGGGLTLAASAPAAPAASEEKAPARYNAEQVHHFLQGFYGNHGPRQWERVHMVGDELKKRAEKNKKYDVLLCAQNNPRDIAIGRVTTAQSAGVGWATVTTKWNRGPDQHFTAYVGLDASKPIKLIEIDCSPGS